MPPSAAIQDSQYLVDLYLDLGDIKQAKQTILETELLHGLAARECIDAVLEKYGFTREALGAPDTLLSTPPDKLYKC